jgi:N12 class adenine-specific DNA methylase
MAAFNHGQPDLPAGDFTDFAAKLSAGTVEDFRAVADTEPKHVSGVMSLAVGQHNLNSLAAVGGQKKAAGGHGG